MVAVSPIRWRAAGVRSGRRSRYRSWSSDVVVAGRRSVGVGGGTAVTALRRMVLVALVVSLVNAACTRGGDGDAGRDQGPAAGSLELTSDEAVDAAEAWLDGWDELDAD